MKRLINTLVFALLLSVSYGFYVGQHTYAEEVVSVHAEESAGGAHESAPAEDVSTSTAKGDSENTSFSGHDADGISNYHATYPYWVYASHPSSDCETHNKNCPAVNQTQLAAYNHQQHEQALVVAIFIVVVMILFVVLVVAVL